MKIEELKQSDAEIARAIHFLVNTCLDNDGKQKPLRTTKPLVVHSLRIAFHLLKQGYNKDIIIAAVLHDLPEDAGVEIESIKNKFGKKVADIVSACTFDDLIKEKQKKYQELFARTKAEGRDALIVKAADILDNSNYFRFAEDRKAKKHLLEKWNHFLQATQEIFSEPIYQELAERLKALAVKL
ncbi:MAG: HD domain-containing protein [Candidatus Cloacimonetes bacterium]|nr:HD domain-containing protein [Candidatus Cloacimonadota bacterium]